MMNIMPVEIAAVDSKLIELLKSKHKAVVLYCDKARLYFDDTQWVVRSGRKKVIYFGDDLNAALIALEES